MTMKKIFKTTTLMLSVILLAGLVALSACKKDEEDPLGKKAAKEFCDCISSFSSSNNEIELEICMIKWMGKYIDQMEFVLDDDGDLENIKFKDKKFQKDFETELDKCDP